MYTNLNERYTRRADACENHRPATKWSYTSMVEEYVRATSIVELMDDIAFGRVTCLAVLRNHKSHPPESHKISVRYIDGKVNLKYDNGGDITMDSASLRDWFLPATKCGSLFIWKKRK